MFRIVIAGSLAVILLGTLGSLASSRFGFPYSSLTIVSLLIDVGVGIAVGLWAVRTGRSAALSGIGAGAIVGLVGETIGWGIASAIGPGRPPPGATPVLLAAAAAFAVLVAAVVAVLRSLTAAVISRAATRNK